MSLLAKIGQLGRYIAEALERQSGEMLYAGMGATNATDERDGYLKLDLTTTANCSAANCSAPTKARQRVAQSP